MVKSAVWSTARGWRWRRWTSLSSTAANPANFLDIGGGAGAEKVAEALRIILGDEGVKARAHQHLRLASPAATTWRAAFSRPINSLEVDVPFVIRLVGTNEEEGRKILEEANLPNVQTATSLADAAKKAVAAAK